MAILDRVQRFIEERDVLPAILADEGIAVMDRLTARMSLREVARQTNLSPTYLSRVRTGSVTISPAGFVLIATLEMEVNE